MEIAIRSRFLNFTLRLGKQPNTHFLFVRHGESDGNVDYRVKRITPNPALNLTDLGQLQAQEVAEFLPGYIEQNHLLRGVTRVALWSSRYTRAVDTTTPIAMALTERGIPFKRRYSDYLSEIDCGSIDGHNYQEVMSEEPWQRYDARDKLLKAHGYGYLARRGDGESMAIGEMRLDNALHYMRRDADFRGNRLVIIVCHGLLMKAAYGLLSHASRRDPEWHKVFDNMPSVPNCGVMHFTTHEPRVINPESFGLVFQPSAQKAGLEA